MDTHLAELRKRRNNILNGGINCIPLVFPRFRYWLPGTEKKRYTIVTANQKVGKSKYADFIYVYETFFYWINNPDKLKVKILYFTLEMSKKDKKNEFLCYLLYKLDNIRISPTDLKSTREDKVCPQEVLDLLESERYQFYLTKFKEFCTYIDNERNPTGINKYCRNFALSRGKFIFKTIQLRDEDGELYDKEIIDYYVPDDEQEYVIVILDNFSNLMSEKGMNKMQTIEKMSKYFITQRDQFEFHIVAIQHQAQAQEGIENQKLGKLKPSSDGLADCKTTTRDANLVLGLYSPYKYGIRDFEGYDITQFKNNIRFLEILEDRDNGGAGQICPLFFDGAVSVFKELPRPTESTTLAGIYQYIKTINSNPNQVFLSLNRSKKRKKKKNKIINYLTNLWQNF